ncbi:MAG: AAA family ATPase [Desulfobacterales bacterium]|nr:AAA family ATPase [Desulfobacterales bacterium]
MELGLCEGWPLCSVLHNSLDYNEEAWLEKTDLLVLDELHKMPMWKNYLKGVYDTRPDHMRILVTGSARLETFRQSGDSLAGRFFRHRLLPFSPAEIPAESLEPFMTRGGFPEPLLVEADTDAQRWRNQYVDGLVRTDILEFHRKYGIPGVQLVLHLKHERVTKDIEIRRGFDYLRSLKPYRHMVSRKVFDRMVSIRRRNPRPLGVARVHWLCRFIYRPMPKMH